MSVSIREAYGLSLAKYGRENPDVVVLNADVSSSTKTGAFAQEFPNRFFNVGIAEANMCSMACGFAAAGKIPFANSFAMFLTSNGLLSMRALASYNDMNVKFAGGYGGLSDSYDGPTHHAIDDLAVTCALPNFTVAVASDACLTDFLVRSAIEMPGPFYLRLSREALPDLYEPQTEFKIGKAQCLRKGKDVTIIACGVMVSEALHAADALEQDGISAGVLDMFTIKPLDESAILQAVQETGALVVAQEHNRTGGLCSAVAEAMLQNDIFAPVEWIALGDVHTESGAYRALLEKYGLDASAIKAAAVRAVNRKGAKQH